MPTALTPGERLFRMYLAENGYTFGFEPENPGRVKKPDFAIQRAGQAVTCEVKDFEPDGWPSNTAGAIDPYPRIRRKIEEGRNKLKEFKDQVCCLVLYNNGTAVVDLNLNSIMLGAMYGDAGVSIPLDIGHGTTSGEAKQVFLNRGKMMQPRFKEPQNTTISALLTLRHVNLGLRNLRAYIRAHPNLDEDAILSLTSDKLGFDLNEKRVGVIVWENMFAAKPLPNNFFNGPFDLRWGVIGNQQQVTFRGSRLKGRDDKCLS